MEAPASWASKGLVSFETSVDSRSHMSPEAPHLSRRQFVQQAALTAALVVVAPQLDLFAPSLLAATRPSAFLRKSPVLMKWYTNYRLPLHLLEPRAKAAWWLRKQLCDSPQHSYWCGNDFDYWTRLAGVKLRRLWSLKEEGTPEAMAEYQEIIAIIGQDVFDEYEWGVSQPPVHF